jgi:hypothetical protein
MFVALKEIQATDDERLAVMAAWDATEPRLAALSGESEEVLERWRELDRRDPGFAAQAEALSGRSGDIARERMAMAAKFEAGVVAALSQKHWDAWEQYWRQRRYGGEEGLGRAEGGGRHSRGDRLTP